MTVCTTKTASMAQEWSKKTRDLFLELAELEVRLAFEVGSVRLQANCIAG
jgi:hypothetical protein